MFFKLLTLTLLSVRSQASHHYNIKRDSTSATAASAASFSSSSINYASISAMLSAYQASHPVTAHVSIPSVTLGLAQSLPTSMMLEIMTVLPASVLPILMDAQGRASLASEFGAGNTPAWYTSIPTDIQSYFASMASQIKKGNAIITVTPTPTDSFGNPIAGPVATTTSSKAIAPPRATGGMDKMVAAMAAGAMGMLGVAIAL